MAVLSGCASCSAGKSGADSCLPVRGSAANPCTTGTSDLIRGSLILFLLLNLMRPFALLAEEDYEMQRQRMVEEIKEMVYDTREYIGASSLSAEVTGAMGKVPRHEFVPEGLKSYAYINHPLPIGQDQTISQPYIVALMTELAGVNRDSIVLEVGTGSGYQAAVLAELVHHVYTIEIIEVLGVQARKNLERLGYDNVTVMIGDGYHGWKEHAPFDAILVTAAAESIPEPLLAQLKAGGRLVIPIGREHATQSLTVVEKKQDGGIVRNDILPVGFVPLTGDH
jgi:protein-L-isoaspartate(D-aspartate) O-methyltransferase